MDGDENDADSKWGLYAGHTLLLVGSDAKDYIFKDSYDDNTDNADNPFEKRIPKERKCATTMCGIKAKVADNSYDADDYFIYDFGYSLEFLPTTSVNIVSSGASNSGIPTASSTNQGETTKETVTTTTIRVTTPATSPLASTTSEMTKSGTSPTISDNNIPETTEDGVRRTRNIIKRTGAFRR